MVNLMTLTILVDAICALIATDARAMHVTWSSDETKTACCTHSPAGQGPEGSFSPEHLFLAARDVQFLDIDYRQYLRFAATDNRYFGDLMVFLFQMNIC